MTDEHGRPGEPGDDARRLLDAVQDWARRTLPAPPSGHSGPECQWCPLCQLASVLRGEHPELLERMTEAAAAITDAVRALAESAGARGPARATSEERHRPRPGPRADSSTPTDPEEDMQ